MDEIRDNDSDDRVLRGLRERSIQGCIRFLSASTSDLFCFFVCLPASRWGRTSRRRKQIWLLDLSVRRMTWTELPPLTQSGSKSANCQCR
jgi:hypothetical protein